ncbi:multicopper oxidase family protein [Cytobacillus oceanisediminis]|uniref:multicopper oxidase family protein n=1 Tax=Cytobacillus oceanisediminis TaxID=665099 RepID=UPI001D139AAE|nr:multicopper oxidase family protein [Cytobacillus oceanisediminis]MCC3646668.1 multicopper oxidase family protein [Cytobacillus oceanisediminis]
MKIKLLAIFIFSILFLAACSNSGMSGMDHGNMDMEEENNSEEKVNDEGLQTTNTTETLTGNEINIVAQESKHQLNKSVSVKALTFNGSVPGSQIRVKQGEKVKINLKNELNEPVSIHWHGIPVPNEMDGIPGVTQNAVQPGETFTYEFSAEDPGTYMYHTHQNAVEQMDKGLYGSFIVEPKEKTYDRDYTLMLDEWMSKPIEGESTMVGMDHSNMGSEEDNDKESDSEESSMSGMDHSSMESEGNDSMNGMGEMGHDMSAYDIFSINGKSGDSIEPLKVKQGEKVRIRLVNAGFMSHKIHLHGHDFKVAAIDGQELNEPKEIKDQVISIAPGERYDIEFTADNPGEWFIECHGDMEGTRGMKTMIQYENSPGSTDKSNQSEELPEFTFMNYGGSDKGEFSLEQEYDVDYKMDLNTAMDGSEMAYTINGNTFPETDNINVKEGDLVKVTLTNNSMMDDHPMHLHGHFFQVISKNGKPVEGSPIMKDTINLKPGDEYVVAFKADNPGNWLFHCHDLHHATAGMVNMVKYDGFKPNFTPNPNANNKPE